MKKVICMGESILSPLGETVTENFEAVLRGESALQLHAGTFGVKEPFVGSLMDRSRWQVSGLSFFDSIVVEAARRAVEAAGIDPASPRTAFVLSSIKGNIEHIGTQDVTLAASARKLVDAFGNPNPPVVVSNACISGLAALLQGRRMLLGGGLDHVVVVGAEVQSRFIVTGFQSLKALSEAPCKPFDAHRDGLNLGEAAAAVVLGFGNTGWELVDGAVRNDANHISGPSRTGEGSYKALRYVLRHIAPEELAFVNVHGTSTLYNDEMESIAIDRAGLIDVPLNALKGYFGHTMGAAGILESILSMRAVDAGIVLPTRGFTELGVSRPVKVSAEAGVTDRKAFVKLLSGFGGVNGVLLFRKGGPTC
ncbi:MAG: beta-ketoacyl synthase [Bacteroidales bacterium]|nr:beta-ketoacyl synthase [Bacteroidales bacterium]